MKRKFLLTAFFVAAFFLSLPKTKASAADFDVEVSLTYSVDEEGGMHIKEERTIRNNAASFYIPASYEETFYISSFKTRSKPSKKDLKAIEKTIKLTNDRGSNIDPEITYENSTIVVKAEFGKSLNSGESISFNLEYDNFELAEKSGNVWNIYIPGLPENYNQVAKSDNGATTQNVYNVRLELSEKFDSPNFVVPAAQSESEDNGKSVYIFDSSKLVGQSAWIQIGKTQYYKFKISQNVEAVDSPASKVFKQWYDLLLPSESSSENQEVFFTSIDPKPMYVRKDGEGNVIARFAFDSNQSGKITVEGYISTSVTEEVSKSEVGEISDISLQKAYAQMQDEEYSLEDLLDAKTFWEVNSSAIQQKADKLKKGKTNVYDILLADYKFVADTVDYDNLKIGINNKRQGALKTLEGGSSVCMEYSDLLITLLRAQGIPARAGFGYGFDHRSREASKEAHQWVEVYMPNVGWVAVDPTWGDTGRKNYIGGDVDHALWYVAGRAVDEPSPVVRYSIVKSAQLSPPDFEIETVEGIKTGDAMGLGEVLETYKYTKKHVLVEKYEQLNIYGKAMFIGIPVILFILFLVLIITSVVKLIKRMRKKRDNGNLINETNQANGGQVPSGTI